MGNRSIPLVGGLIVTVCLLVGCTKKLVSPLVTEGTVLVLLPMANSDLVVSQPSQLPYEFKVVDLQQIFELKRMNGAYARFFLNPGLKDNHLVGERPQAQFFNTRAGYYVAANSSTLELASIYYHVQKMAQLDSLLGYPQVNKWPRDVGIGAEIRLDDNSRFENNIFYDAKLDAMLVVPYVSNQLPLSVNAGVLAHEHFHSLFYKLLTKPLIENKVLNLGASSISHESSGVQDHFPQLTNDPDISTPTISDLNLYQMTFLKSFNEGFADFWGWMYTHDDNYILNSLRKISADQEDPAERNLSLAEGEVLNIPDAKIFFSPVEEASQFYQGKVNLDSFVSQQAYRNGTLFAKTVKSLSLVIQKSRNINKVEAQREVAKSLLKALEKLKLKFVESSGKEKISPSWVIQTIIGEISNLSLAECENISKVIRFVDSSRPLSDSKSLCSESEGKVLIK